MPLAMLENFLTQACIDSNQVKLVPIYVPKPLPPFVNVFTQKYLLHPCDVVHSQVQREHWARITLKSQPMLAWIIHKSNSSAFFNLSILASSCWWATPEYSRFCHCLGFFTFLFSKVVPEPCVKQFVFSVSHKQFRAGRRVQAPPKLSAWAWSCSP